MVRNRRPEAGILDVPAKCLEAEAAVGPPEQVDAAIVLGILDALEDEPRFVDALSTSLSIGPAAPPTTGQRLSATAPSAGRADAPAAGSAARADRLPPDALRASASSAARSGPSPISHAAPTACAAVACRPSVTPSTASCRSASAWPARTTSSAPSISSSRASIRATRRCCGRPCRRTVSLSDSTIGWARGLPSPAASADRLAPPFEADARQHRLARDGAGARKLVIEGQQGQQTAALRLGREQRRQEAVAVRRAHLVEHVAVRRIRGAVGTGHGE